MRKEKVNRTHKDRLFRMLFGREECKENALSLYNAVNQTSYENAEDLVFTTIDDAIFMSMKNDVSFLFGSTMNLYEQQSTYNPNMPVRGLMYFGRLYSRYTEGVEADIFKKSLVRLPTPQFVVFYNGTEKRELVEYLRLTDAMDFPESSSVEVTAKMININRSKEHEILDRCRVLREYSEFIGIIRRNLDGGMDETTAVHEAVDECIEKKILYDVLRLHKAEVVEMSLTEYNEQRTLRNYFEDGREEGFSEGLSEGLAKGKKEGIAEGIKKGKAAGLVEGKAAGIAEGKAAGLAEMLAAFVRRGLISREDALKETETPELLEELLG